jgi:hypothetical protein
MTNDDVSKPMVGKPLAGMTDDEGVKYLKWLEGPRSSPFTFSYKMGRHSDSWKEVNPKTLSVSDEYESHDDDDFSYSPPQSWW